MVKEIEGNHAERYRESKDAREKKTNGVKGKRGREVVLNSLCKGDRGGV